MIEISFISGRPLPSEVLFYIGEKLSLDSCAKLVRVSKHVFPFTTDESFLGKRAVSWQLNIPKGQLLTVLKQGFPLLRSLQRLEGLTREQLDIVIKGVLEGDHGQLLTGIMKGFHDHPIATLDLQCISPANRLTHLNIGGIFTGTINQNRPKCLHSIINCSRFTEISAEGLGSGFESAALGGFLDCLQAIIQCNRFANIPLQSIKEGRRNAMLWGHKDCIEAIVQIKRDDVQKMLKEPCQVFSMSSLSLF